MNWKLQKNIAKIFAYIFILLCLYQSYLILHGYYERNKDSPTLWSLQEKYAVNGGKLPEQVQELSNQFQRFQISCLCLIIFAGLVEYYKYKENPEKYNEKNKNSWTSKTLKKISDWMDKNHITGEIK